jgi:exodeoxyribonuclease V gamma subunit
MIRLVYSNRTEELVSQLAANVRAQQARDGALVPVRIVVPSRSLEGHVRLGIARREGIAANLAVDLLTSFATDVAAPRGRRVADAGAIEAMALQLLLDDRALRDPDLASVVAYLRAAGDSPDALDLRRVQLASRIGRLFEEYTYSRGEMLAAWRDGPTLEATHAEVEAWQRRLWLAMFGPDGLASRASPLPLLPLHEAVGRLEPSASSLPKAVHVFGFAHVARTFHQLFARLGRACDVTMYTLSPCEGFWEDVDPRDPELLLQWARPGRENVRALNELAGFDHDDAFRDPPDARGSLLRTLQSDLLHRKGTGRADDVPSSDATIQVLEHASVRRECEAVASAIWEALREDPSLHLDEISVLVPSGDAAVYAAHVAAAFQESHDIPYQTVGLPEPARGRIVEALELLLELPLGNFSRREVVEVITHPAVVASVPGADRDESPARWLAWCDALGIVHGADHADHAGTYIEHDVLNWDQGLRRLSLGAFMTGEASGEPRPFVLGEEAYLPHEVAGTDMTEVSAFGRLVRSLLADARFLLESKLTPSAWADVLTAMVQTYVAPSSDAEGDELARRLRHLGGLSNVDLGGRAVSYRLACELARARLRAGTGSHGGEGVVVSTVTAARGLPSCVVFACGLGEGKFPSPDAEDPLDLRWAARQQGDVTARDRDKYALLEVLVGTRDRLVLSYVSRDPLTGDALSASSVVHELLHALATSYGRDVASLRRRHPLRRWDPAYFPRLRGREETAGLGSMELPEAYAEARSLVLREDAERHGATVTLHDVVAAAEGGEEAWVALADHLRLAPLPPVPPQVDAKISVPMHALVKFLELPLQGWAKLKLGLEEQESDDVASLETEPFETSPRDETLLLRDVLLDAVDDGTTVEDAYDTVARVRELHGTGPSGVFARGEKADHLHALDRWRAALQERGIAVEGLRIHRFGRGGEHTRAHEVHPALPLDVAVRDAQGVTRLTKVEIAGRTLPVAGDPPTSVVLAKRANETEGEWPTAGRRRQLLRAYVDYAMLAASGVETGEAHGALVVVATRDGVIRELVTFRPMSPDDARSWLRDMVAELLSGPHAYFLPCEAVFVHQARTPPVPLFQVLEEARGKLSGDGPPALRSAYGPVPRPQSYPLPDEAAAHAMIDRRFGRLLAALEKES